jgi:hydrogenase maturation protein HypF
VQITAVIKGIVQGVGFRPFVYRIATKHNLKGFVRNIGNGVEVLLEGEPDEISSALNEITKNPPEMAIVQSFTRQETNVENIEGFQILKTPDDCPTDVIIPPDIGICPNCRREILDSKDRRYHHLMISCTDCGPRLSILRTLPYDRHTTSAGDFTMCPTCQKEYKEPADRRYHAQTIACPNCGPVVSMGDLTGMEALCRAKDLIKSGKIVAIKGIGGFHLACLATNQEAVDGIRKLKHRGNEPLAVMVSDEACAAKLGKLDDCSRKLLNSWRKPIVLVPKSDNFNLSQNVAPGTDKIGLFLPYTPFQVMLMEGMEPIVLTSSNIHDEPISVDEKSQLVADILTNDREIVIPLDDSVTRCLDGKEQLVRRARGYVPQIIPMEKTMPVLALGPQMKSTFAFSWDGKCLVSPHIGELGNPATFERYKQTLDQFRKLFGFAEEVVAYDMHPDYTATRHRHELSCADKSFAIQHHHAHIASVIAEHGIKGDVIGIAADGTGFGIDGTIWGSEFFTGNLNGFEHVGQLLQFKLPGGEVAVTECFRTAFSLSWQSEIELDGLASDQSQIWKLQLEKNLNSPTTSSLGRLFDGFSVIAGMGTQATFEAELAIRLESQFWSDSDPYQFPIIEKDGKFAIDWRPAFVRASKEKDNISGKFHIGLANAMIEMSSKIREKTGINTVAMSGGCFLNLVLSTLVADGLKKHGFLVHTNNLLPPGDGCVSFGQAAIAQAILGGSTGCV